MKLACLDLFSGIGGIALGFRDIAKTVGYCELDDSCVNVLRNNIGKGLLDAAPIFKDVQLLCADDLIPLNIEMITAGSPCQDISPANPYGKGIHGPKSKLIFDVIRIAQLVRPTLKCIVLENSCAIVHKGMDDVLSQLRTLGFGYIWSTGSATEVGALHHRRRWVCIAFAPGYRPCRPDQRTLDVSTMNLQSTAPPVRVIVSGKTDKESVSECGVLGNSVVPAFMLWMYRELLRLYVCTDDNAEVCKSGRRTEMWCASTSTHIPLRREAASCETDLGLMFQHGTLSYSRPLWSTPRKSAWFRCKKLTDLTLLYLTTKVLYERTTQLQMTALLGHTDHTKFHVNPRFVEWLMGFPYNWTMTDSSQFVHTSCDPLNIPTKPKIPHDITKQVTPSCNGS
jgi:DNA (cytosine-5)-methyltransferase 1